MLLKGYGKNLIVKVLGVSSLGVLAGELVFPSSCQAQVSALVTTHRAVPYGVVNLSVESGFGNGKYVDGYVKMTGTGTMIFPVGHKGIYHPFAAKADGSVVGSYFRESAEAPSEFSHSFKFTTKAGNVGTVSPHEFWNIDGTSSTKITLIWDADSHVDALTSGDLSKLRIIGWDASSEKWTIVPAQLDETSVTGVLSSLAAGSITTSADVVPDAYSIYTLGTEGIPTETQPTVADTAVARLNQNALPETAKSENAEDLLNLKIVDSGNTVALNKIGEETFDSPEVVVYPNPVASTLYLRIPASEKLDKLEILDLNGKAVLRASSEATSAGGLNIENLRGGIYIVKLLTESGLEFSRKVVVKDN